MAFGTEGWGFESLRVHERGLDDSAGAPRPTGAEGLGLTKDCQAATIVG